MSTSNDISPNTNNHPAARNTHHENPWGAYGGNPLAHALSYTESERLPAFAGALQPGLYKPPPFKFGNPVPLGLAGFALTTWLLSLVNLQVGGLTSAAMVIAPALVYGGFIQMLAGMWDIALGNTFGGTALSSYGGFWISIGIILTPGLFEIESSYATTGEFYCAFGLYIFGWFAFTFLIWLLTLKSTVAFSLLFLTVWLDFMCIGIAYVLALNDPMGMPSLVWQKAGGGFGVAAGFVAWYLMLAGLAEADNSFFISEIPVLHFPWSERGRAARGKTGESRENQDWGHAHSA